MTKTGHHDDRRHARTRRPGPRRPHRGPRTSPSASARFTAVDDLSFDGRARPDHRVPRPQRRRQDDDDAHAARPDPPHRRDGDDRRARRTTTSRRRCRPSAPPSRRRTSTPAAAAGTTCGCSPRRPASPTPGSTSSSSSPASPRPPGKRAGGYSMGMRQRLGLAAALLGDPQVLVLDEPANGLDPEGIRWLRGFLRHLSGQGKTILVSSHLLQEMEQTVDDIVIITNGRLVQAGPVSSLHGDATRARPHRPTPQRSSGRCASPTSSPPSAPDGRSPPTPTTCASSATSPCAPGCRSGSCGRARPTSSRCSSGSTEGTNRNLGAAAHGTRGAAPTDAARPAGGEAR